MKMLCAGLLLSSLINTVLTKQAPDSALFCTDWRGDYVAEGEKFFPQKEDACHQCTCDGGFPVMCANVQCLAPSCPLSHQVEGECCVFHCISAPDHPPVNGTHPTPQPEYEDSELGLRLVASAVTSLLILILLLFMVHRLRQRRLLITMRRLQTDEGPGDDEPYLTQLDQVDLSLECPPYQILPPPYSPPKTPDLPEDEPPPYEEVPAACGGRGPDVIPQHDTQCDTQRDTQQDTQGNTQCDTQREEACPLLPSDLPGLQSVTPDSIPTHLPCTEQCRRNARHNSGPSKARSEKRGELSDVSETGGPHSTHPHHFRIKDFVFSCRHSDGEQKRPGTAGQHNTPMTHPPPPVCRHQQHQLDVLGSREVCAGGLCSEATSPGGMCIEATSPGGLCMEATSPGGVYMEATSPGGVCMEATIVNVAPLKTHSVHSTLSLLSVCSETGEYRSKLTPQSPLSPLSITEHGSPPEQTDSSHSEKPRPCQTPRGSSELKQYNFRDGPAVMSREDKVRVKGQPRKNQQRRRNEKRKCVEKSKDMECAVLYTPRSTDHQ